MAKEADAPAHKAPREVPSVWQAKHEISDPEHAAVCAVGGFPPIEVHVSPGVIEIQEPEEITEHAYSSALRRWREGEA